MPDSRRKSPLERSTLEAYGGTVLGILGAIVTAWWAKCILLAFAGGLIIHATFRSSWTIKWPVWWKAGISAVVLSILAIIGGAPILEDFRKQHPGTTETVGSISQDASKMAGAPPGNSSTTPSIPPWTIPELDPNTLMSSEGKALFRCEIPPSDPFQFPSQYQNYKNGLEALGDALGYDISISIIPSGIRIVYAASSDEGKLRMWRATGTTITKATLEVRRVGQTEVLSFIPDRPSAPPGMMIRIPLHGTKEDFERFERSMERLIGAPSGVCHLF
jgi:hypothetical protein